MQAFYGFFGTFWRKSRFFVDFYDIGEINIGGVVVINMNRKNTIPLDCNDVHVWLINPNDFAQSQLLEKYHQLLSTDEKQRLAKYTYPEDRHDALITRAFVRTLLTQYTQGEDYIEPEQWRFKRGGKGKPEIVNSKIPLRFNISHTKGLIACAVTLRVDVGIDVEYVQRKTSYLKVADHKFSPSEVAELNLQPRDSQRSRFFDYWTLKESYIKAVGVGLTIPLDRFSFDIRDYQNIEMSFDKPTDEVASHWQNWLFDASNKHRMGLSVKDPDMNLRQVSFFQAIPLVDFWPIELPIHLAS